MILLFSSLQNTVKIFSGNLIQPDHPMLTEDVATHFDCSTQNHLRKLTLTCVQNCSQTISANESSCWFAWVFVSAKAKRLKVFHRLATFWKTRVLNFLNLFGIKKSTVNQKTYLLWKTLRKNRRSSTLIELNVWRNARFANISRNPLVWTNSNADMLINPHKIDDHLSKLKRCF